MPEISLPTKEDLMPAVLRALDEAGGSLARQEVKQEVLRIHGVTEEQAGVVHESGPQQGASVVLGRAGWALSACKAIGATTNSERGVWALTPRGRELLNASPEEVAALHRAAVSATRRARGLVSHHGDGPAAGADAQVAEEDGDLSGDADAWKTELLQTLTAMDPAAFERLCALLLREFGCRDVEVTRYSDDEGLDGTGTLEVSLLSFPVFFQAKRYARDRAIQPSMVREFRGAMAHRGDKGIFITTGTFTQRARDEARRGGAPIDLIDGDRLCELLREKELGVRMQPVVDVRYFAQI